MLAGMSRWSLLSSGGTGIRTLERVAPLAVFKTAAFVRSAIPPAPSVAAAGGLLWDVHPMLRSTSNCGCYVRDEEWLYPKAARVTSRPKPLGCQFLTQLRRKSPRG